MLPSTATLGSRRFLHYILRLCLPPHYICRSCLPLVRPQSHRPPLHRLVVTVPPVFVHGAFLYPTRRSCFPPLRPTVVPSCTDSVDRACLRYLISRACLHSIICSSVPSVLYSSVVVSVSHSTIVPSLSLLNSRPCPHYLKRSRLPRHE